jgi:hypothetical protein
VPRLAERPQKRRREDRSAGQCDEEGQRVHVWKVAARADALRAAPRWL